MSHERHGSQIILHSTTCWANCSGWQQRKHQRTALLVLCLRGIHWRPMDYPHKRLVTRKVVNENKNAEVSGPVKFAMASWNEITLAHRFSISIYITAEMCVIQSWIVLQNYNWMTHNSMWTYVKKNMAAKVSPVAKFLHSEINVCKWHRSSWLHIHIEPMFNQTPTLWKYCL